MNATMTNASTHRCHGVAMRKDGDHVVVPNVGQLPALGKLDREWRRRHVIHSSRTSGSLTSGEGSKMSVLKRVKA